MIRIHREGYPTLLIVGIGLAVIDAVIGAALSPAIFIIAVILSLVVWGFFAQFFRDPARTPPSGDHLVIAPADGKVVAVERVRESEFLGDERLKISIYMSAFDVHVNRVPISGKVIYYRYHPGKYLVAFHPKASELNERNTIAIERADGQRVVVRQIAGILARRIVSYLREGQAVRGGEVLGFIKFGSRCDIFLPPECKVRVQLDEHVKGGETILAEF